MTQIVTGERIADEAIYLEENRYDEPKEASKQLVKLFPESITKAPFSLCDVGGAAGEFIYYVQKCFPQAELSNLDVVESLLEKSKRFVPNAKHIKGSIDDASTLKENSYDITTMIGVIGIFDDPQPTINNLIHTTKPGGSIIILNNFNKEPVDVVMRMRRAYVDWTEAEWEKGWNLYSRATVEKCVKNNAENAEIVWHDFAMPFALPKKDGDPLRGWTTQIGEDENALRNGANLIQTLQFAVITLPE